MSEPHTITLALLSAMAHGTEPMVLSDPRLPDHPMIAVNAAFESLTGYSAAETIGRNCRFLQGADTDSDTKLKIRRCIAEGRGCIEWVVNYRRDGTRFWNLLFLSPVFAPDGTLLHFFGNQRDITKGPPADLADYSVGKADMPAEGLREFHALVAEMASEPGATAQDASARAQALERVIEAARRLNEITIRLEPAPWTPPGP